MRRQIGPVETFYQLIGQGEPLVLLHGWGCNWQIWHPLIAGLSDNYQLIIPDLPAFGQSADPPLSWNSLEYVEWLVAFLTEVSPDSKFTLIGHSFGGKVATLFAVKYPDRVKRLICIDSAGIPDKLTANQLFKQTLVSLIPARLKTALSPETRAKILGTLGVSSDHSFSTSKQRAILKQVVEENIVEQLTLVKQPTLLIWGENDQDTPPHQAKLWQNAIINSQLLIIPNAGHFPFIDQPQIVLRHILDFIS